MPTSKLIINPYSQITMLEDAGKIVGVEIEVPILHKGKNIFQISTLSNPDLVDFILDLTRWGFTNFNAEELSDSEHQLLAQNGFLVNRDAIPEKPLFNCFLDEIEIEENDKDLDCNSLTVNPSFRIDPFDLTKSQDLVNKNNFSPFYPIGWIKSLVTKIEIPYWFRNEYIEIAQNLKAGEQINFKVEKSILAKFVQAGIVINPDTWKQKESEISLNIENAHKRFVDEKYVVLEELLPKHYMQAMKKFFREYVANGFMPFSDSQVKRRYYQHNLPLAQFFHKNLVKIMSSIVGMEVRPSYVYAASYVEDAILDPHIDREQCEYSISFQVDYHPKPTNDISPWGLYVTPVSENYESSLTVFPWKDFPEDDFNNRKCNKVNLSSGDGLFYKGRELIHYRYALPKNHKSTSLFFHYVASTYDGLLN